MDAVKQHYEKANLIECIDEALKQNNLINRRLSLEELAPMDHFHVRGIEATTEIANSLQANSQSKILDIGSGLGGPSRFIAKMTGAQVTGIDLTQSYVDAANYLSKLTGLSDLAKFDCGNATSLPYADATFDMVMTQHVAMNIENRDIFYSEAYRVLKPGGRFALYDVIAGDAGEIYFPVPFADTPATSFLLSESALKEVLDRQKFKIVSWQDRTEKAIEWVSEVSKRQMQNADKVKALSLSVVAGPNFGLKAGNLARSLKEGKARILEVVATK